MYRGEKRALSYCPFVHLSHQRQSVARCRALSDLFLDVNRSEELGDKVKCITWLSDRTIA